MPEERPRNLGSDPKQFVAGRAQGLANNQRVEDRVIFTKLLFRLIGLPIWLPYKGWKTIQRKRQMTEFAIAHADNVAAITDDVVREVTLEWVENHPSDFAFGEYDPKVMKVQRTFKKILESHR